MAKNGNLHKAKEAKNDEFYTRYDDIQNELNHYERHFKDKTILCNCDDPFESNFCKFFLRNFNYLGLKRLICTSYNTSPVAWQQITIYDYLGEPVSAESGHGYVMDITEVPMKNGRGVSDEDIEKLLKSKKSGVKKLKGDGDFRSDECIEYLKQADIVVTNPPFSLFREYVSQLIEYNKQFLIIGSKNAITYKEIFPLIKENRMWMGIGFNGGNAYFAIPLKHRKNWANGVYDEKTGLVKFRNLSWYTNLDHDKRHEKLILYKKYYGNEKDYPKYDNYDAINVDKVADIPCDYFDDVGVPVTYLDKYNPEQFEIVKFRKGNDEKDLTYTIEDATIPNGTERNGTERNGTERNGTERNGTERNGTERNGTERGKLCLTSELSSSARCNGIMGVPITFIDRYNPEQFEIIGLAAGNIRGLAGIISRTGKDGPYIEGKLRYGRVFIRRKM